MQFLRIRTSKSALGPSVFFWHFDFILIRFSPQRRAIFAHRNFQKCSRTLSFLTFWLHNTLFATAACIFWFLCWAPTSAPAALTGLLFDWPDTRIIEKTRHFATSLTFGADVSSFFWLSRYCIFFLLTWLLYSAFQLSILSEVCYLNFLRLLQYCSVLFQYYSSTTLYYKVLRQYYSVHSVLLCTTKYYSSTILYYKALGHQYYSVLQNTTPVLLCTTKYYASTTRFNKVLCQYYAVLQSTTPVLLRTTPVLLCTTKRYSSTTPYYKVLFQHFSVLLQYYSSTSLYYKVLCQYYSVLQSARPVLLCTTKYYASTTLYYKVLRQYYSVQQILLSTTKHHASTNPYYSSSPPVLLCTAKYYSSTTLVLLCTTKYYASTTKYYSSTTLYNKVYPSTFPYYKVLLQY